MVFKRVLLGLFDVLFSLLAIIYYLANPSSLSGAALFIGAIVLIKGILSLAWSASEERFIPEQQTFIAPVVDVILGVLIFSIGTGLAIAGLAVIGKGVSLIIADVQYKLYKKSRKGS